jgi:apolipoprotein N-acyltransferase
MKNALRAVALSLLTGVLFALSLPPHDVEILGWVAFVPLLSAASEPGRRPLHAFGLGVLTCVVAGAALAGWRGSADGLRYAYLPFLWLGLVIGAVSAAAAWYRGRFAPDTALGLRWAVFVACVGVAAEWLTTLSPLPVGVALTQHKNLPLIQTAAYAGMWGVSFLLYLVNAAVVAALASRRVLPLAVAVPATLLCAAFGRFEQARTEAVQDARPLPVAAVQEYSEAEAGRYAPAGHSAPDDADEETLLARAAAGEAVLIVGSEEGLAAGFRPDDPADAVNRLARDCERAFVVGYQERGDPKDFNGAALVDGGGKTRSVHRKLKLFLGEKAAIQAGDRVTVAEIARPDDGRPVEVGTLICFDTCYPGIVRDEARQGAQVIAVPNFDPPVPGMVLHHLHAALMPFRAVENHVALVRADPNGKSMIVSPSGRVVAAAPLFRSQVLSGAVPLGDGRGTPYTAAGDWLAALCGIATSVLTVRAIRPAPKRADAASPTSV